jgi:D-serine deaminase-like pyridoxal phosphate-dependent protein
MSGDQLQADVSKLKRICLRLDNGTRIGFPSALGIESAAPVVKLDFVEGFSRGIVSEADLIRISEIAGQLEDRKTAAAAPSTKAKVCTRTRSSNCHCCHVSRLHDVYMQQVGEYMRHILS